MRASNRPLVGLAAVAALAFPALAIAKKPDHAGGGSKHGSPHVKQEKPVSWNFKGEVTAVDGATVTVHVTHSNRHGRSQRDLDLTFDLANAQVVTADTNADGVRDVADVAVGDEAKVQARLSKSQLVAEGEALPAKKAIFKAPEPVEDEGGESESETESAS